MFLISTADSFIALSTEDTCLCTALTDIKASNLYKVLYLWQTHRLRYCSVRGSNQCMTIYIPSSSTSLCKIQLDKRPDIPSDGCAVVQLVWTIPFQVTLVTYCFQQHLMPSGYQEYNSKVLRSAPIQPHLLTCRSQQCLWLNTTAMRPMAWNRLTVSWSAHITARYSLDTKLPAEGTTQATNKLKFTLWAGVFTPAVSVEFVFSTLQSPAVTICTAMFNFQQFYVLLTQGIYVFCVDLRTNSDYFPIQH